MLTVRFQPSNYVTFNGSPQVDFSSPPKAFRNLTHEDHLQNFGDILLEPFQKFLNFGFDQKIM